MPRGYARQLTRLREAQREFLRGLSDRDLDALEAHYGGPYFEGELSGSGRYGTEDLAKELEEIMRRAPRSPDRFTTYRGTSPTRLVPERGYPMTTTPDRSTADAYAEGWSSIHEKEPSLLAIIDVPERAPFLTMDELLYEELFDSTMPFGDELEVLLPNAKMREPPELHDFVVSGPDKLMELIQRYKYEPPFKARGGLVRA